MNRVSDFASTGDYRFAAIVQHCEDAIISLTLDGIVTSWNFGATKLFGFEASEMTGQSITRILPEDRLQEEVDILRRISSGERVSHFETRRVHKDGHSLDISITVSPIKDAAGTIVGASKIARDISARKRNEIARQKLIECSRLVGREFMDAVVEALAQALDVRWVLLCDLHPQDRGRARVLSCWSDGRQGDPFEYDLCGTPCANVLGDTICFYPNDVASLFPDDALLADMGAQSYLGVPLRGSDGRSLGLLAVLDDKPLSPALHPEETLELFAGRASAELQRVLTASANERLGRIVEDAASETFVFDAQTLKFILVNRGARENLGYTMAELQDMTPLQIKPNMTTESFMEVVESLRSGRETVRNFETVHRRKDGTDYNVSVTLQLLEDEARPVFFAAIEDTTARDAALRALTEVSQRLDTVLTNTKMAVFLMDQRQECVYMNPAAERLTGYRFEETLGRPLHDVIHHSYPDGRPFPLHECAIDRAFPEENQVQGEEMFVHKDGTFYPVAYTASPIRDDHGKSVGTVVEARDITNDILAREAMADFNNALQKRIDESISEREAIEAQLRQAQKMEAMGKLTGGVAHDFNNLLQVIGGNLHLLLRDVSGNVRAEQRAQNAIAGVSRGAKLASQLLAFGRKQPLAPEPVNLGRLVHGMDDLLRRTLGEGIEVETVASGGLWNTLVDKTQVENALLNLAINARDAMNGNGKLTIEVGNASLDDLYARQHPEVQPGHYVMLAVTDTGCGIPPDIIDQVFEPFFTTKPVGKGTGLGLSMVYGLIKQSNGHTRVYSELGQGTTIRIYLPRTRQDEAAKASTLEGPVRGGSETILVVEDDDDVRATVVELLSELGYRVLRATDAASGLAIVESGIPIDMIFTDVVMPGPLQSRDMARRAQERIPGLAVLFTSGYTENSIVHGGRLDDDVDFLSKPYTRETLAHRVRACLEKGSTSGNEPVSGIEVPVTGTKGLTVLLVEDEILIRLAACDMVTDLGHTVFEAGSAGEALEILESNVIDVLISDVGLPDRSGLELAEQVRERWPAIRIVIASGNSPSSLGEAPELGLDVEWLVKPFEIADIERALSSL
ncbi:PAS domain S-box protein [Altererythrobacter sp. KTW20L]|uniref:PAS domain S-box protein n=1 Tax=Altererythrobacter sp. KTW20L TaxID=2942210 RepID=UPI0020BFEEE1|nr:PAS domain S-box protein [Altererythrobacter sp. KTW20L]MCL6250572.1 PAS domain S-box protein [Altererythrobacter sp. KTW20L]